MKGDWTLLRRITTKLSYGFLFVYVVMGVASFVRHLSFAQDVIEDLLFDFHLYEDGLLRVLDGADPYEDTGFFYPPLSFLILVPIYGIRYFPLPWKTGVIVAFNLFLLVHSIWRVTQHYKRSWKDFTLWCLLFLTSASFLETLYLGQVNIVLLWGLTFLLFGTKERPWRAALGWMLAAWLKISPFLFAFSLCLQKRYRVLIWAIGISFVGMIVVSGVLGWKIWVQFGSLLLYLLDLMTFDSETIVAKIYFALPYGELRVWFRTPQGKEVSLFFLRLHAVYLFAVVCVSHILAYRQQRRWALEPVLITLLAFPFLTNIVWYHYWVFVLFALMVWWMASPSLGLAVWIALGSLIIQLNRYVSFSRFPLSALGLLSYGFLHLSLLHLLWGQVSRRSVHAIGSARDGVGLGRTTSCL